jgi:hypothetical protein
MVRQLAGGGVATTLWIIRSSRPLYVLPVQGSPTQANTFSSSEISSAGYLGFVLYELRVTKPFLYYIYMRVNTC